MADGNNCTFTGRLTKDAELKTLPTGQLLCQFDIANNTGWGDKEKVLFIRCSLWGERGNKLHQYLLKGKFVWVQGGLELQTWTGKADGVEHSKLVLDCKELVFLGGSNNKSEDTITQPIDAVPLIF